MDLSEAVGELYGITPEEFVETRKRLAAEAKKSGDAALAKSIGALRRPTVSAWAVNRLARDAPDELEELLDLGAELRSAWESGGRPGELDQRRAELVTRLSRTVLTLADQAGRPLREPATREVEDTLHAATMDPAVAEEVRDGRLAQPRTHVGFGPVGALPGLAASPARTGAPARPAGAEAGAGPGKRTPAREKAGEKTTESRAEARRREREEARRREEEARRRAVEQRAAAAAAEAEEARRVLGEWENEAGEAERAYTAAGEEVERLRRELEAARERQEAATKRLSVAERERNRATRRADETRRRAQQARDALET
ncbi:hypothetical protein Sme01_50890 [Sphaerisporangium melleum]|uniref:Uncharacterized protein n=1 Tax=Sphaerisporangium melleum TaxID=321316 RepID=A0A917QYJ5_9ACTN|nr:hypothetical protein [Sphaerisporangium melleum]GGK75289.1 hypothetical protein GCM10007964_17640 [Sphaerisporangium melleum]GII72613.1 hypothetical protein Sme01_50890 [Sphaerisporangium melleum]